MLTRIGPLEELQRRRTCRRPCGSASKRRSSSPRPSCAPRRGWRGRPARAQHLLRPRPARDGRAGDLLRRQGRASTTCRVPSRSTRPCSPNGAQIVSLAPGRHRHRHAGAAARQRAAAGFPDRQTVRQAEGERAAGLEPTTPRPASSPTWTRADFGAVPGGRRSRSLTRLTRPRPPLRHNSAQPATNSARSTRPETRMSRLALAALASAALLAACAPMPPPPCRRPERAAAPPAGSRHRRLGRRRTTSSWSRAFRRSRRSVVAGGRALRRLPRPRLRRLASDAGARCWSSHRKAGANTTQIYRLAAPLGELEQLTDFAEPVRTASYEPMTGDSIVFERSSGGDEAAQLYRLDLATRQVTPLTEPDMRHDMQGWLHLQQPAALLLGAARPHRRRRPARRDRADADPGRPGATGGAAQARRASGRRLGRRRRVLGRPPPGRSTATSRPPLARSGCSTSASGERTRVLPAPGSSRQGGALRPASGSATTPASSSSATAAASSAS